MKRDLDRDFNTATFWLGVLFILGCLTSLYGCQPKPDYSPICRPVHVRAATAKVVNGVPSQDRRATVKVFLAGGFCSGTIVGPHTVLLAAHCKEPKVIAVEDFGAFEVVETITHPAYNSNVRTDLRLAYTENELPAPFAQIAEPGLQCEQLVAQGYGFGSDGELHERNVETVVRYDEIIIGTESICNGDSGGPLYALRADGSYVLVGVTSFGAGEPYVCDGPVGFMSLFVLGSWVEENIK